MASTGTSGAAPSRMPSDRPRPVSRPRVRERVILRSLPKVVFLYPTIIAAVAAGAATRWWSAHATWFGVAFLIVLFLNMVVISFDFPRTTSLSLFFLLVAVVLGALLVNARWFAIVPPLKRITGHIQPQANDQFYWLVGGGLVAILLVVVFIERRFDYWEVNPNQIIHHTGLLHTVERYPAPGLEMEKDIIDVFEFFLLGCGRLVIHPSRGPAVILENVPNVNRREREIQTLLGVLDVEIVNDSRGHQHMAADL